MGDDKSLGALQQFARVLSTSSKKKADLNKLRQFEQILDGLNLNFTLWHFSAPRKWFQFLIWWHNMTLTYIGLNLIALRLLPSLVQVWPIIAPWCLAMLRAYGGSNENSATDSTYGAACDGKKTKSAPSRWLRTAPGGGGGGAPGEVAQPSCHSQCHQCQCLVVLSGKYQFKRQY